MVKIKTKKTMSLPQLIEWALKNGIKNTYYVSENRHIVTFDENGFLENSTLPLNAIFTVEVGEEITEDTVLPELVELYEDTLSSSEGSNGVLMCKNTSIRRAKDVDECPTRAFYIPNDDLTLDLVWTKEKGLVK